MRIAKKDSGLASITYAEALDEALDASLSLLVAQHSDTVLLLIVARRAKPACCRD